MFDPETIAFKAGFAASCQPANTAFAQLSNRELTLFLSQIKQPFHI
jgi:hypothetical protein